MINWPNATPPTPEPPPLPEAPPSAPDASPTPTPAPPTGWSARRIKATAANSIIGFILGIVGPPVWAILSFGCTILIAQAVGLGRPELLAAVPIAIFFGYIALHGAAHGTCSKSPVAPLAVAIGILLGAVAAILPHTITIFQGRAPNDDLLYILGFLTIAAAQSLAALKGGRRGLAKRFGQPQRGIGLLCATCAYDLEHTPEGWPCPECGGMMRYPTKTPAEG